MKYYLRSQIAKKANLNIETLRYYEKNKLIPAPLRNENGYRLYKEELLNILFFIKSAKNSGFTLEEIRKLFSLADDNGADINRIEDLITIKISEIDDRILELLDMQKHLKEAKKNIHTPHECPLINSFKNCINK